MHGEHRCFRRLLGPRGVADSLLRPADQPLAAQAAGLPYDKHLAGGILGWKAAGQPTKAGG